MALARASACLSGHFRTLHFPHTSFLCYRHLRFISLSSKLAFFQFHTSAHIKAMSESLAAFRSNRTNDLKQLAEEHLQHE
jgi:hypothetical protein